MPNPNYIQILKILKQKAQTKRNIHANTCKEGWDQGKLAPSNKIMPCVPQRIKKFEEKEEEIKIKIATFFKRQIFSKLLKAKACGFLYLLDSQIQICSPFLIFCKPISLCRIFIATFCFANIALRTIIIIKMKFSQSI